MKVLCFVLPLAMFACAVAGAEPSKADTRPEANGPIARRRILAAELDISGSVAVLVAERLPPGGKERYRLIILNESGRSVRQSVLGKEDNMQLGHSPVIVGGKLALGWVQAGKGVMVSHMRGAGAETKVLLPDDEKEGPLTKFWHLAAWGRAKLIVEKAKYPQKLNRIEDLHRHRTWLYCYDIVKDQPRLSGKVCVDADRFRSSEIECVRDGKRVLIWQVVSERGSSVQTLRVAEWRNSGLLKWSYRYIGVEMLGLRFARPYGSRCIVTELKSPEARSFLICCVQKDVAHVCPVGTLGEMDYDVKFARIERYSAWAVARGSAEGVVVDLFDDKCSRLETVRMKEKGVLDFAFANSRKQSCVVLVRPDSVKIRPLLPKIMRPATSPSPK